MPPLDPKVLTRRFGVLPMVPDWNAAQDAREILESDRKDEGLLELVKRPAEKGQSQKEQERRQDFVDRLAAVREYVQTFEEHSEALILTLLIGAALAGLRSRAGPDQSTDEMTEQLYEGTRIVAESCDLMKKTDLSGKVDALGNLLPPNGLLSPFIAPYVEPNKSLLTIRFDDAAQWRGDVQRALRETFLATHAKADEIVSKATIRVGEKWRDRFISLLNDREVVFPAIDADLICEAAQVAGTASLPLDLKRLKIEEWSRMFSAPIAGREISDSEPDFPAWVFVPAAIRLRLSWCVMPFLEIIGKEAHERTSEIGRWLSPEAKEDLIDFAQEHAERVESEALRDAKKPQVVIVTGDEPGVSASWKPSNAAGAVMTSYRDIGAVSEGDSSPRLDGMLKGLLASGRDSNRPFPDQDKLFTFLDFVSFDEGTVKRYRELSLKGWGGMAPSDNTFALAAQFIEDVPYERTIVAPKSLIDAVRRAQESIELRERSKGGYSS